MVDFARQRLRSRFEARLLSAGADGDHAAFGERKRSVLGAMRGTVVEIGPGTGANMRYYATDTEVIAIEPNPVMHEPLRAAAHAHGISVDIRMRRGESLDVADDSVDGVVGTLLLCGVDDPSAVIAEAFRVLKPGGTYFFVEHVVATAGSGTRTAQRIVRRPHRWLFNGCEVDRQTGALLRASDFSCVEYDEVDRGLGAGWVRDQIVGTATKPT